MPSIACSARLVLLSSGLFLLPACSHPKPEADEAGPAAEPVDAPAPAQAQTPTAQPQPTPEPAPAADAVVKELTLTPNELTAGADPGVLEYCLDCRRKSATYNYCEFNKDAFESAVGPENMAKTVTLRVEMVQKARETHVPDDPNAPQPDGGFSHVRHDCSVDAVLSTQ